ncbi:MAG TPA: hypothetical protein ENO23_03605, partial [Alphaproteobacteria bacterium]|nr:hypothetical protein [Alphaproteobacteria bacterium]
MTSHKLLIRLALFGLLLGAMSLVVAAMPSSPAPRTQALHASKQAPATAAPGDTISYTIAIQPYLLAEMAMTDTLPAGVQYAGNLAWSAGEAWYSDTLNTVFWEYEPPVDGAGRAIPAPDAAMAYAWNVLAPPPTATTRPAGAVDAAGNFYIIGGDSSAPGGRVWYGELQRYDPVAGTWDNSLATMPVPLGGMCAAVVGDDIYVPGGSTGSGAESVLQVYHVDTDTWDTVTSDPLPAPRSGAACAAYGGKVYVIGGYAGAAGYAATTWVYDPGAAAGARWTTNLAGAPLAGGFGAALAVGDLIFYAGMRDSESADLPDVYAYDPAADAWATYPDLATPRGGACMWAIDHLLLVGGGGWETYLASVEQYDTTAGAAGAWSAFEADLAQGRRTFACATDPAHGHLFAGNGYAGAILAEAEQLDFEGLPPPVEITFDVTVTGVCGDEIVNHGTARLGDATDEFTATTVVGGAAIAVSPATLQATLCTATT